MIRSYAVVTPARDEAKNLPAARGPVWRHSRSARGRGTSSTTARRTAPSRSRIASRAEHDWVRVLSLPGASSADRGAPVVRALQAGIAALSADPPEIVVKVDADISMDADYFECLLGRFDADASLGIASGSAFELQRGTWRQRYVTGTTVWGASRAYRWECLQELLPARGASGLGRARRVQGKRARLAYGGVRGPSVPPSPARRRARRYPLGGRARIRGTRRTTSVIVSGTSFSVPCGRPAGSRPRSR